ncbi:MAG TPA: hypothetical protein VFY71_16790 [Planctomycetota bacterium]|nr:hypothetical protein [Planctomycetota bacterium]
MKAIAVLFVFPACAVALACGQSRPSLDAAVEAVARRVIEGERWDRDPPEEKVRFVCEVEGVSAERLMESLQSERLAFVASQALELAHGPALRLRHDPSEDGSDFVTIVSCVTDRGACYEIDTWQVRASLLGSDLERTGVMYACY